MRRIVILLHENDVEAERYDYIAWALRDIWREPGHEVVAVRGLDAIPDADVLLPHLDLTVVPDAYARVLAAHPRALNRGVRDVSKSAISTRLVRPGDGYDGPVIVKTDRNHGGNPDRRLLGPGGWRQRAARALRRHVVRMPANAYPIFESPREVPRAMLRNPALVVERFVPEVDDGLYCSRVYTFCGERHVCSIRRSPRPIVKSDPHAAREETPVHEEIVDLRRRLGFDYGKFDFVVHAGTPVLLDANPTPSFASTRLSPAERKRAELLADGLAL